VHDNGNQMMSPVSRLLAWIVDALLIGAGITVAGQALCLVSAINADWYAAVIAIKTPGKHLMHLRVVDLQGLMLEFHLIAVLRQRLAADAQVRVFGELAARRRASPDGWWGEKTSAA
jgi:hypothetical protein